MSRRYQEQAAAAAPSRYPSYQSEYEQDEYDYPQQPPTLRHDPYSSNNRPSLPNDSAFSQNSYPPLRMQQPSWSHSSPDLPPSPYADPSDHPTSLKAFSGSVDLEGLGTDDGTVRPMHSQVDLTNSEVETGWRAALWPRSKYCRAYILTVVVETVIDMTIEGAILQQLSLLQDTAQDPDQSSEATNQRQQTVYLGIFVLAHVLQMVLAIDAVYNKNTLQFLFLAFFNLMLLIYGAVQIVEVQTEIYALVYQQGATSPSLPIHALINLVPCVIAVAEVAYIALGWQIWKEFGWKVYKFLGADRNIKRIYGHYQIFQCLLKFDIFFWVGFSVQWIGLISLEQFEFDATVAALPLSLLLLVEGYLAARHENKWMMTSFMLGCVAGLGYFVYKAWRIFEYKTQSDFKKVWKSLLIFACVSIGLLLLTFASAIIVMLNFNRGLKENMNKKSKQQKLGRRATTYGGSVREGGGPSVADISIKRMSIE